MSLLQSPPCLQRVLHRRLLSGPLQHHLGLLHHTSKECLRLLRPLLKTLLRAREFLRTTNAFQVNETRSFLLTLSCREIVDGTHCISKSRLISNLSFQCENLVAEIE